MRVEFKRLKQKVLEQTEFSQACTAIAAQARHSMAFVKPIWAV